MVDQLAACAESCPGNRKARLAEIELLAIGVLLTSKTSLTRDHFEESSDCGSRCSRKRDGRSEAIELLKSDAKRNPRDGQTPKKTGLAAHR